MSTKSPSMQTVISLWGPTRQVVRKSRLSSGLLAPSNDLLDASGTPGMIPDPQTTMSGPYLRTRQSDLGSGGRSAGRRTVRRRQGISRCERQPWL